MAKAKKVKKKVKKVVKKVAQKVKKETGPDLKKIAAQRDALINMIKPNLLTNTQLREGTREIRARYQKELSYKSTLPEINELGALLGLRPIGLGHLRRS